MSLFSLQFVVLLGITLLVYYIVPKKYQWIALLAASMIFYVFSGVVNLLFIGITSLSTWIAGRMMFRFTLEFKEAKKKEGISKEQKKELKAVLTRKKKRTLLLVLLINIIQFFCSCDHMHPAFYLFFSLSFFLCFYNS